MAETDPQFPELAEFISAVVRRAGGHGGEIAKRAGLTRGVASISEAKKNNPRWTTLDKLARGAGFRHGVEMFTAGGDPLTARLLRMWRALPDDEARRAVLREVKQQLVADEESTATSVPRRSS